MSHDVRLTVYMVHFRSTIVKQLNVSKKYSHTLLNFRWNVKFYNGGFSRFERR